MQNHHIVRSYDEDLTHLNDLLSKMGGVAENQISLSIESLKKRDSQLADQVIKSDQRLNMLEEEIKKFTLRLLALRQPMADDLRIIVSAIQIASNIERIGDLAKNIARRSITLNKIPAIRPVQIIPNMAHIAQEIIKDVLDAFIERNVDKAMSVWSRDEQVDNTYNSLFRELLTYMMENPKNITPCAHLLFIAKNIERMGDHATNIAEIIYFVIKGKAFQEDEILKNHSESFEFIEQDTISHHKKDTSS